MILNARTRRVTPYYSVISARLAGTFNANLARDVSPEEAVQSLQVALEEIIEQQGG